MYEPLHGILETKSMIEDIVYTNVMYWALHFIIFLKYKRNENLGWVRFFGSLCLAVKGSMENYSYYSTFLKFQYMILSEIQ